MLGQPVNRLLELHGSNGRMAVRAAVLLKLGQVFGYPWQEGQAGGVKHSVGDDCRPNGAVQNHDDSQREPKESSEANGQHALRQVAEAKQHRCYGNCSKLAGARTERLRPDISQAGEKCRAPKFFTQATDDKADECDCEPEINGISAESRNVHERFHVGTVRSHKILELLGSREMRQDQYASEDTHQYCEQDADGDGIADPDGHRPKTVAPAQEQVVSGRPGSEPRQAENDGKDQQLDRAGYQEAPGAVGERRLMQSIIATPSGNADEDRKSADERKMNGPAARADLGIGRSVQCRLWLTQGRGIDKRKQK